MNSAESWVAKIAGEQAGSGVSEALRAEALQSFLKRGFPAPGSEAWRYTDIRAIRSGNFSRATAQGGRDATALQPFEIAGLEAVRIEMVDGFVVTNVDTITVPGVVVRTFRSVLAAGMTDPDYQVITDFLRRQAQSDDSEFRLLNGGLSGDGLFIRVRRGQTVAKPIEVVAVVSAAAIDLAVAPRALMVVEDGASATVLERFIGIGQNQYYQGALTECVVGEDATLTNFRCIEEGCQGYHIGEITADVAARGVFTTTSISVGGALIRSNLSVRIAGERARAELFGLSVLAGAQHVDNHTLIDHQVPNCESVELYKGIYAERARGVFCGTIIVAKDAQKTNAFQSNRTLLLSPEARVDSMPQLKIWADDVKCTHGATVGQLDETALFYLRSRGIGLETARAMLTHAFAREVTSRIQGAGIGTVVREYVENLVLRKLGAPDKIARTE